MVFEFREQFIGFLFLRIVFPTGESGTRQINQRTVGISRQTQVAYRIEFLLSRAQRHGGIRCQIKFDGAVGNCLVGLDHIHK
jgi:hypothetical protein